MRSFVLTFLLIVFCGMKVDANESFYKEKARGWHWYEKKVVEEDAKQGVAAQITPSEEVEAMREDAKEKLHKAMMRPTQENVKDYIKAQEVIGDKSERFAKVWMQVIYSNPELDRTLKHPTSDGALKIARSEASYKKKENIRAMSGEYGLIYFFKGNCPYCDGFASVVKNFSQKYNWDVMAIKMGRDGHELFPEAKLDNGMAKRFNIKHVPTLLAVHPRTGKIVQLAHGYIAESEIEERVNTLIGG